MIIKACERGGANKLAIHLLNEKDNEHVEVHELRGFVSGNLKGALNEAYAVSRGTKCRKFMFSVILSPPARENVSIANYEEAARLIEKKMGLIGQPRAFVFHEKEGRRHAHVVWSRIDTQKMKAINLPYFKNKLNEIAKSLYLKHEWKLPKGFIDREKRNPLNYTRQEWYQAKKLNDDNVVIKATLQECWAVSDNKKSFIRALDQKGYYLARGDRRGFVAVDWRGEVYSLSRKLNQKNKTLKARLGEPAELLSVEETIAGIDNKLSDQAQRLTDEIREHYRRRMTPLVTGRGRLKIAHCQARDMLKQEQRQVEDAKIRQARLRQGFGGLWDKLTGRYKRIQESNRKEALGAQQGDTRALDKLRYQQIQERQRLQKSITQLRSHEQTELRRMRETIFSKLPEKGTTQYRHEFDRVKPETDLSFIIEL